MRFRKSVKLAPGVRINLSKSGISTTLGRRGASVTIGGRGRHATAKRPGTGIRSSPRLAGGDAGGASNGGAAKASGCASAGCLGFFLLVLLGMCLDTDRPSSPPAPGSASLSRTSSYSASDYATSSYGEPAAAETRDWLYIHGSLNVRAEPDKSAAVVRTLRRGDYVQLGPKDTSGWARVYSAGTAEGYVYRASELVQRQAPSAERAESTRRGVYSSGSGGARRSSGGRVYHTGPRGGCYYISGSGRKQYVDHSYCY